MAPCDARHLHRRRHRRAGRQSDDAAVARALRAEHCRRAGRAAKTSEDVMKSVAAAKRTFVDELLDVLSNVLFPVVVFLVWAVMTTIGTIVDQNQDAQHYYDMYPAAVANLILHLHLDTVLHSIPYFSLIVLLLISMTVCTFRRVIPKRFPKDRAVPIENFGLHGAVASESSPDTTAERAEHLLRGRGFLIRAQEIDGARWLFGDKHTFAR